jgi:hypothetical protein
MFQFSTFAQLSLLFGNLGINACLTAPPELFAAFHALHRLPTPRHPPCALNSLTTLISITQSENHTINTKESNHFKILIVTNQANDSCLYFRKDTARQVCNSFLKSSAFFAFYR